jgi:hypothetical protein
MAESRLEDDESSRNKTRLRGVTVKGCQSLRTLGFVLPASSQNKITPHSGCSPTKHDPQLPNEPLRRDLQRLLPPRPLNLDNRAFPAALRAHQQPDLADVERDGEGGEGEGLDFFRGRWGLWDGLSWFFEGPEE